MFNAISTVSIPLKSGRCCKHYRAFRSRCTGLNPFEVREVLQGYIDSYTTQDNQVSIPLKSGRCCKEAAYDFETMKMSQSL